MFGNNPNVSLFASGAQQQQQGSGFFGGMNATQPPQQGAGIFGNQQQQGGAAAGGGGLFGQQQPQQGGNALFGGQQQQQPQQQQGGLFSGQPQQQQQTPNGLFGGAQNQQQQAGGLFGQPQGQQQQQQTGGLFQQTQPQQQQQAAGGLFQQQQAPQAAGGLFGSAQPMQSQPTQAGGLFSNAPQQQQQQQPANNAPAANLFGGNQQTGATQGQQGLFQGQQSNPAGPGLFGAQSTSTQSTAPQAVASTTTTVGGGLFGAQQQQQQPISTPASLNSTGMFGNNTQQQQQPAPAVAATTASQGIAGGLFGQQQPAAQQQQQQQQQQGGLFGQQKPPGQQQQPAPAANQTTTTATAPAAGGLFGTQPKPAEQSSGTTPAGATTSLFGGAAAPTPAGGLFGQKPPATTSQPAATTATAPAATTATAAAPATGGLFGTSAPATGQAPPAIGLFGSSAQQQPPSAASSATASNSTTATSGLFAKPQAASTTGPAPAAAAAASNTTPATSGLFGKPPAATTAAGNAPAPAATGLFGATNPTAAAAATAPTGGLLGKPPAASTAPTEAAKPGLFGPPPTNGAAGPATNPPAAAAAAPKPAQPAAGQQAPISLFDTKAPGATTATTATAGQKPESTGGLFGGQAPAAAAPPANAAVSGTAPVAPPPAYAAGAMPQPRKAQQAPASSLSSAANSDPLSIEIESARKLNGSLHMFCQNIHKYSKEQVKAFFADAVIHDKLSKVLLLFNKTDPSGADNWEAIKKEAKEGKTPLVFWNERLSKYKYQYLLVLLIEELAAYVELKPIDAYNYFNIFLSHENKLIDIFFDPSSNEPCIEFFYEHHALTYEAGNITINKQAPFISNLRTSFMHDMYFHERNCILASLRLLLLMTECNVFYFNYSRIQQFNSLLFIIIHPFTEQQNYSEVRNVVSGLLSKGLQETLWKQYTTPPTSKSLSPEDSDAFLLQLQFEQDQILKLLFIIASHKETKQFKAATEYLEHFVKEQFLGNSALLQSLSGSETNSFENKNRMNEFATVIGDSALMLCLQLLQRGNNNEILQSAKKIVKNGIPSQQLQLVQLWLASTEATFRVEDYSHIENFYKVVSRVISYKNLGVLKAQYQTIFFKTTFKILHGLYDVCDLDKTTMDMYAEFLARSLAKIIHKNSELITEFWNQLENKTVIDQFKFLFNAVYPLYKIMKSAMGSSFDPKADKVIVFLSNIEAFSWTSFYRQANQELPDENQLLRIRLTYKLICVDPKCIELLQLVFNHSVLTLRVYEDHIGEYRGDEVIRFVVRSLSYYANLRVPVIQNFFCGLKAVNVLLSSKQQLTQQVLQTEEYSEILSREYSRIAQSTEQNSLKYKLKCKREILSILHTILRDFEEPLLAFAPQKGLDRSLEYDSPLLNHLFIFYRSFVEDWDQNTGLPLLKHKWKIGTLIMQITEISLSRLSMNIHKKSDFRMVQSDIYTTYFLNGFLVPHLKTLRIDDMIMKVLEVSANFQSMQKHGETQSIGNTSGKNLRLKNKLWQTYVSNSTMKFKEYQIEQIKGQRNLRVLILHSMRVVERILSLVQQKIAIRKQDFEVRFLQKSMLFEEIPLLDFFERILCKLDCVFHYKQEYYFATGSSNNSIINSSNNNNHQSNHNSARYSMHHNQSNSSPVDSMKINLLYAIASYLNFENRVFSAGDEYSNPTLPFYLYSLFESEAALFQSIGDAHLLIDYNSIKNPLNLTSIPNGTFVNSISALSLRILTQIMLVWEGQSSIRKPILVDFLSNMNMENYWEKANYSSVKIQLSAFIQEMLNILRTNELESSAATPMQRKAIADESCAVLDFLLTAIHTQPLLINILLKPDSLAAAKNARSSGISASENGLKMRFMRFFETDSASKEPRLFHKYLSLLSEIFARESMYAQFCQEFRQGSQNIFEKMTRVVLEQFKPYEIDALVERELTNSASAAASTHSTPDTHVREFQKWKLSTLLHDQVSHSLLHNHMLSIHSFRILLDILANEYLSNKFKSTQAISNSLRIIFDHNRMNDLINSLSQFSPNYALECYEPSQSGSNGAGSTSFQGSAQAQLPASSAMEQEGTTATTTAGGKRQQVLGSIFVSAIWQLLEVNSYGYGWNYAQDTSELVLNKVDIERSGEFFDRAKFLVAKTSQLRAKSLKWSIEEIKAKAFDSWIRLFCLVTSSGSEGFAMSAVSSALPNFTIKQLRERKIVHDHEQLQLLYPNYEIEFVTGFVNVFSNQQSQCVGLFSNLQNEMMRQILTDMKKSAIGSLLDSKFKMLLYLLNSLRHLQDIDRHRSESERVSRPSNPFPNQFNAAGPSSSAGAASASASATGSSSTFTGSYSLEEADDHLKFMTQILEEIVTRESRVSVCDFIQCLFLQLQMIEVMHEQQSNSRGNQKHQAHQQITDHMAPYYSKLIGTLMNLFVYVVDGLPIVVSCLNSILHIYPIFFIAQFHSQPKALECLLHKIYYEKNETAQIFISVVNLLRDFASFPEGSALLSEVGLVNSICNSPLFKTVENEPFYWQNGERNLLHSFWCWTLSLYKEFALNAPTDLETTFASLQFMTTYFTRIAKILSIPAVLASASSSSSSSTSAWGSQSAAAAAAASVGSSSSSTNRLVIKEQEKLSLAYMEELAEVLDVLAVFFSTPNIFKHKIPSDFEQILQFLTHCTIHLFKQGLLVQSVFMPVSKMEKKLLSIYETQSFESNSHLFTSMQTPSQTPMKTHSNPDASAAASSLTDNKGKSMNMFFIQIEMHYQKILLSLSSCIADGLSESNLVQLFSYSLHNFSNESSMMQDSGLIYAVSYWQNFAGNLLECLKYAENTLNKWDATRRNKGSSTAYGNASMSASASGALGSSSSAINMDDQLFRLNAITNSVEYNLCTYSFSASTFMNSNAKQVLRTTLHSLAQLLAATIRHFHLYNSFRQWFGHSIRDTLVDVYHRISQKVDSFKKVETEDHEIKRTLDESINAFKKLSTIFDSSK